MQTIDDDTYDVRTIRGADDDHRLFPAHAVHLRQQLIDDAVARTASIT